MKVIIHVLKQAKILRYWIWFTVFIMEVNAVQIYDPVETDRLWCQKDVKSCRMPQSRDEQLWAENCFRGKCSNGTARCITDSTNRMHYICATREEMMCGPGDHGVFRYSPKDQVVVFDKVECSAGTYTLGSHDCRMSCRKHHRINLIMFVIIKPPSVTGDPALVECNRAKNYCPISHKYGTRFNLTSHVLRNAVCGQTGSAKACLPDEYTKSTYSNNRNSYMTDKVEKDGTSTEPTSTSAGPKASVKKQDVGIDAANYTAAGHVRNTSPTSTAQTPVLASVRFPRPGNHDLSNIQLALIILPGFCVAVAISLGVYCFWHKRCRTQHPKEVAPSITTIHTGDVIDVSHVNNMYFSPGGKQDADVTETDDEQTQKKPLL